jgi:iron complex outermembrane recepter protein
MRSKTGHAQFKTNTIRIAVLTALLTWHTLGATAEPAPAARYHVDQPSQPLSESLRAIAKLTGSSVLFDPGAVNGRMSHPVSGQLSGAEAISRALEGTGLASEVQKDGAIVIKPRGGPGAVPATPPVGVSSAAEPRMGILLAQATDGSAGNSNPPASAVLVAANEQRDLIAAVQKIQVTGSRIRRVETDGALPVNVYTREDIDKSGQPNLAGFLNTLNEVSIGSQQGTLTSRGGGQATVQLRGLPVGTTLVLINGRRVPTSGLSANGDFFNLDLIPFAAIERIEILPVGSSAVYGGDALAGVVNIILKKSFDGWAVDARLGSAKGANDGSLSLVTGGSSERGSFLLMGAYSKQSPLSTLDRDFFKDADYRRFGGPDARSRSCTPGTVSTTDGSNLPGLTSSFAGIPSVPAGQALTISNFVPTAGVANLCAGLAAGGNGIALVNRSETYALHAAGDHRLGDAWQVFGELTYTERHWGTAEMPSTVYDFLEIPAANPFNPFGVPVRVQGRLGAENGLAATLLSSAATRALVGARGELGRGWELEASIMRSQDKGKIRALNGASAINFGPFANALAAPTPELALNPFTTGRAATDEVLNAIWPDAAFRGQGKVDLFNAFVRGSLGDLPAGPVDVIAGVETGRSEFRYVVPPEFGPSAPLRTRRFNSQFAELRVPLASAAPGAGRNLELAALTLAGRRDNYSDFGKANTYQMGLEVRPVREALLRAATATSFQPPTLPQSSPQPRTFPADGFGLTDPLNGNQPIPSGVPITFGLTPNLKPQKGKAQSLGALWEPNAAPGLRLGLTTWQVKLRDQVIIPGSPQVFLDNEALFPGYVTRGPAVGDNPGPVTALGWTYVNFGRVDVLGTDIDAAYALRTSFGKWNLAFGASKTSKYEVLIAPGAAVENRLGNINTEAWAPKWKGRLSAGLERGPWSLGGTARYLGGYKDFDGVRDLGELWFFDLTGSLDLKQLSPGVGGAAIKSATLSAAVVNVGDKLPQFSNNGLSFYDPTQGDWRGRYFTLRLSATW